MKDTILYFTTFRFLMNGIVKYKFKNYRCRKKMA